MGRQKYLYDICIFVELVNFVSEIFIFTTVSPEIYKKIACLLSLSTMIRLKMPVISVGLKSPIQIP
jgi:hypothetical protein